MANDSSVSRVLAALRVEVDRLAPGGSLPSTRSLVSTLEVSPNTVSAAVARLVAEGLVITSPGRGTVVAPRGGGHAIPDTAWQAVALPEHALDARAVARLVTPPPAGSRLLSWGYLHPDLQPIAAVRAAAARAARRPGGWDAAPPQGLPELRAAVASSVDADPADTLIVPGGQAGLMTALRALAPSRDTVLVEAPTYLGFLAAATAAGRRTLPVPADADGIRPDLLADAFARTGSRLLYLQPTYANPTAAVLSPQRRTEVLEIARTAGAFILEDDWARYLDIDGSAPPPLAAQDPYGCVVHLSSLSKATAPSLRIAALIARGPAASRLFAQRVVQDLFVSRPLQEVAAELLVSPAWSRHLRALRSALRRRRDILLDAIETHLQGCPRPTSPGGGLHVWLPLPDGIDDIDLVERARSQGLALGAGTPYFGADAPAPYLRITFAAAPESDLAPGVAQLAALL